ncbi:MAG: DUF192 domain-containing protein [Candidatus Omnitrophota bacterium]
MRKIIFLVFFLLLPVLARTEEKSKKICFQETCVNVEIADSEGSRARGLMFRKKLPEKSGMFFIFPGDGVYSFWMKNTFIPLDIIWMDKDFKVVHIKSFIPPCRSFNCPSYNPGFEARYVLEVNAGFTSFHRIEINDKAELTETGQ